MNTGPGSNRLEEMTLVDQIVADITTAMKAKDADRLSTLRMVKANLMNRKIEKGSELTDEEVQKALQSLVKQRKDSIEQYEKAGRAELAAKEAAEVAVIEEYLLGAASPEDRKGCRRCSYGNRCDLDERHGPRNEGGSRKPRGKERRRKSRQRGSKSQAERLMVPCFRGSIRKCFAPCP